MKKDAEKRIAAQLAKAMAMIGSYSRGAVELERNRAKLRLIDGDQFVELDLENYTHLSPRYRSLIPLKQIYVPDLPKG
jgi:restriction system protein